MAACPRAVDRFLAVGIKFFTAGLARFHNGFALTYVRALYRTESAGLVISCDEFTLASLADSLCAFWNHSEIIVSELVREVKQRYVDAGCGQPEVVKG
jgi:hypothetical protein